MDDIGNILYIIAMIGALVFSAIKKQKQAKKRAPMPDDYEQPSNDPMSEDDVLDELRELFQKPKVKKAEPVVEPVKVKSKPLFQQNAIKREKIIVKDRPEVAKLVTLEDENSSFEFDKEQIDLRQAVIYSEILRRPYE